MFGFFIGTMCLIGLVAVLRRGRRGRHRWGPPFASGCGPRSDHGAPRGWRRGWDRPSFMLRGLFERLDTTPGQEKVIRAEAERLRDVVYELRREVPAAGDDLGRAMRGEHFDETIFGDMFTRQDDRLRELRKEVVGSMARIHDALDEQQRKRLAEMLESGRVRPFWGPYR